MHLAVETHNASPLHQLSSVRISLWIWHKKSTYEEVPLMLRSSTRYCRNCGSSWSRCRTMINCRQRRQHQQTFTNTLAVLSRVTITIGSEPEVLLYYFEIRPAHSEWRCILQCPHVQNFAKPLQSINKALPRCNIDLSYDMRMRAEFSPLDVAVARLWLAWRVCARIATSRCPAPTSASRNNQSWFKLRQRSPLSPPSKFRGTH